MKLSRVFWNLFEFRGILILRFSLNTTFCGVLISRSGQNTIIRNISNLNFEIFMCMSFQYFRNFGKSKNIYFYLFFHTLDSQSIKNIRKSSFWFKSTVTFIIWVYNWIYKFQNLIISLLWKLTYIALCKIFLTLLTLVSEQFCSRLLRFGLFHTAAN